MNAAAQPFNGHADLVRAEWVDFNDHFHMGYYALAFEQAQQAFVAHLGLFADGAAGTQLVVREGHVCFLRELRGGAPLRFETLLLDFDPTRVHCMHRMLHAAEAYAAATCELVSEYVDVTDDTRSIGFSAPMLDALARTRTAHAGIERPAQLGRVIGLVRRD